MLGHFPKGTKPASGRIWLSGSKISIAHRASHGTFYQAVKTNNSKRLSKNTLLQKDLSIVCFRKFSTHLQSSLLQASYCREPCDNASGNCPVNHPARQSWICGYISWACSPAKCRSTSSQLWQSDLLSKKWEPNMFSMLTLEPKNKPGGQGTGSEERASIHFPRAAEPRGGSLITCTAAILVHAHFRPGLSSSPQESVLGWRERKRRLPGTACNMLPLPWNLGPEWVSTPALWLHPS